MLFWILNLKKLLISIKTKELSFYKQFYWDSVMFLYTYTLHVLFHNVNKECFHILSVHLLLLAKTGTIK